MERETETETDTDFYFKELVQVIVEAGNSEMCQEGGRLETQGQVNAVV